MQIDNFFESEKDSLRDELVSLKGCQITFLTSSVAATGALLGIGSAFAQENRLFLGIIFLLPLVILLPAWLVFFDKATTITRIVGYYRILEGLALGYLRANRFMGWENALREFRQYPLIETRQDTDSSGVSRAIDLIFLRMTHRYWVFCYLTFFLLSSLCLWGSVFILVHWYDGSSMIFIPPGTFFCAYLFVTTWNIKIVWNLIYGKHSYDYNESMWRIIMGVNDN